ncbi:MAG: alpha-2,8-polysialyltransferase family protein [Marinilabiliaceae bacterium]|nr:alpha-2,8-polysialyltransferase family protein [Marinilabiliaceae bacterium]
MKEVVIYVHSTSLWSYFVEPLYNFISKEFNITILNLDKKTKCKSNYNKSYNIIDISDYSIKQIQKFLTNINPIAVILLNYISIYELLIQRIAKNLGIKTIYLEHGIFSKTKITSQFKKMFISFKFVAQKNIFFLGKYVSFIYNNKYKFKEFAILINCVLKKNYIQTPFDKAIFFSEYGYIITNPFFLYNPEDVVFCGYPFTLTNSEYQEYLELRENKEEIQDNKAIYIHQPFILDNLVSCGYEQEKELILSFAEKVNKKGFSFEILLHPRESLERYKKLFAENKITIKQNINGKEFANYSLVIGHYSTALFYPVFFNIPISIEDYFKNEFSKNSVFATLNYNKFSNRNDLLEHYNDFRNKTIGVNNCSFENIAKILSDILNSLK